MKYKLYDNAWYPDTLTQIFTNRGFAPIDIDKWINCELIDDPCSWLDLDNMCAAVRLVKNAIENNKTMTVVTDPDVDGFTSAAIFINYLYKINPDYVKDKVHYFMHSEKQHGLSDFIDKYNADIIICPDSSTNDIEEHHSLKLLGKDILVLDHHHRDVFSEDALIVNNQISQSYDNKDFSGAGIVYKFCQAYDEMLNFNYANEFLDLTALGLLSDMMLYTSYQTRIIIKEGLQNIKNIFLKEMVKKQEFSLNKMGGINYMSFAFYITPLINAVIRSGTMEEKELVFSSMIDYKAEELIPSEKRGHKGEMVPRVEEAVRVAANVKARQTRQQDAAMEQLENKIIDESLLDNAILIFKMKPGQIEKNLAGLVANKMQSKYQRPTFVLTKREDEDGTIHFAGSMRNYSKSEVEDLRQLCEDSGFTDYVAGHASAAGISFTEENLKKFIEYSNDLYKNISNEPIYWVDYEFNYNDDIYDKILTVAGCAEYWGQGMPEALIAIEDIPLNKNNVILMSPDKRPTLKIQLDNGVSLIKFGSSQEEFEEFTSGNKVLTIVGKCNANEWNGVVSPQVLIEDYELREQWVF